MARPKARFSVSIDADLTDRMRRLAKAMKIPVSGLIERCVRDQIEQEEMAVKFFTDPMISGQLVKLFSQPDVIRGMARALTEDLSDDQLKLFTDRLASIAVQRESPPLIEKMKVPKKRGKGK